MIQDTVDRLAPLCDSEKILIMTGSSHAPAVARQLPELQDEQIIIEPMARGSGPETALVALGYAGWSAGQLENELAQNAWLTVPCDERILFDTPYEHRWRAAGRLLGVDLTTISDQVGHA